MTASEWSSLRGSLNEFYDLITSYFSIWRKMRRTRAKQWQQKRNTSWTMNISWLDLCPTDPPFPIFFKSFFYFFVFCWFADVETQRKQRNALHYSLRECKSHSWINQRSKKVFCFIKTTFSCLLGWKRGE